MEEDLDLRARLQNHNKAFEGLMSLIPAQLYYGQDNSDQWQRKKQTKEEKRQAKRAKLDPSNPTSALDVHRDKEKKRKRELDTDDGQTVESQEKPREGLKVNPPKKQKLESKIPADEDAARREIAEKKREKRQRKLAKKNEKKDRQQAKKAAKKQADGTAVSGNNKTAPTATAKKVEDEDDDDDNDDDEEAEDISADELEAIDFSNLNNDQDGDDAASVDESAPDSPTFDHSAQHSSASSSSSIVPPPSSTDANSKSQTKPDLKVSTTPATSDKKKGASAEKQRLKAEGETEAGAKEEIDAQASADEDDDDDEERVQRSPDSATRERTRALNLPNVDTSILQARLAARIEALRAARKADGLNGKPAKNRQELIEARRRKEEQRRAHKKELRAKARVTQDAEAEAARLRGGSGSPLWSPAIASPRSEPNQFDFGRVAFDDGAEMDASLSRVAEARKKKGPKDTKTALNAAQKKLENLQHLDADKRADIEEKDRWLSARKRVHGEKQKDDATLLKRTLKREEKQKNKSEKSWNERIEAVQAGKEAKQRKREDNLQKRRDMKGNKGKPAKKGGIKKKRPGFEGSFKAGRRSKA